MLSYLKKFSRKLILLFIVFVSFSLNSFANTISGTVSLPNGVVAGPGGVEISLQAFPLIDVFTSFESATIPPGQSSAQYTFNFAESEDREIQFDCESGCETLDVTTTGAWSNTQGVVGNFGGQRFSGAQNHVVNITLEPADTFSGKVVFPENFNITGNEFIIVRARSTDRFSIFESFSTFGFLEFGDSEFNFSLGTPSDISSSGWNIEVTCLDCSSPIGEFDYFGVQQSGGVMTTNENLAFVYSSNRDHRNLNLSYPFTIEAPRATIAPIILPLLLDE